MKPKPRRTPLAFPTRSLPCRRLGQLCLAAAFCFIHPQATQAQPPQAPAEPGEAKAAEPVPEGPPRWRFRKSERPVKVIVLAGSIGARPRGSYSQHLEQMCSAIEVQNLSKTGYGAAKLAQRFDERALKNRYAKLDDPNNQYWLVFGGGLNSVSVPERTNHVMRRLFTKVHKLGFSVLALSLTPWGSDQDTRRWAGVAGLRYLDATQKIVDFVMGRLNPDQALGDFVKYRRDLDPVQFHAQELPDLAIDLFDSPLRHYGARTRKLTSIERRLPRNRYFKRKHQDLDSEQQLAMLKQDALRTANIPQYYLHPRLHSFDAIHPNAKGHKLMADLVCPSLPASWGCKCEPPQLLPR